ncbi:MAG: hypothetical protein MRECE_1c167 [Mycoplasmataceae bacterium CE_OT135]|nr:MAG: hypothetical protein MRECE_1c167 [Mycoplasmataceae bacterium CE_OT135]
MTSEKRKSQLQAIKEKLDNPNLSLLEVANLNFKEFVAVYANNPVKSVEEFDKEEYFLSYEISTKIAKKYFDFIDQWKKNERSPDEKELDFLKRLNSLIPSMIAVAKQGKEQLDKVKHLSEEDKQKLLELSQKDQENWKKYQPILKNLIEQEREREREEEKNSTDSAAETEEQVSSPTPKSAETSSPSSGKGKEDGAPWKIIVPVGIGAIGLIGLVVFLIWRKKNGKKLETKK